MAKQVINIGTAYDDPTADKIRDGFDKCNDNFTELYTADTNLAAADSTLQGNIDALESDLQGQIDAISTDIFTTEHTWTANQYFQLFTKIGQATNKDITSGALTPTSSFHKVTGEGGSADDLATISGTFTNGTILILVGDVAVGAITIVETGNIRVKGGTSATMDSTTPYMFIYFESLWLQI